MSRKKEYNTIEELLEIEIEKCNVEDCWTKFLLDEMKIVKDQGFFTKKQFILMGVWKSSRIKPRLMKNDDDEIIKISKNVYISNSENERITELVKLKGVGIPVASAILTLTDPFNYGVIDIRAWEILYAYEKVSESIEKKAFPIKDWINYLNIIRELAKYLNLTPRDIERTLYFYDVKTLEGNLYD